MSESKTLLQFLVDLLSNKEALAEFKEDPQGALQSAGLENVCVQDIQELLPVVLEKGSPEDCAKYEDDCDDDTCYDNQSREQRDDEQSSGRSWEECNDDQGNSYQDVEIQKVITHLTYVTNNFTIDESVNVWNAGEGDVLIVSGDGNVIGDGNVTGNGNTIGDGNTSDSFGDGNVVGDGNGSGNISGELDLDLGLLPELPLALPFGSTLPLDVQVPDGPAALTSQAAGTASESKEQAGEDTEPTGEDHGSYTEVSGDGNIIGDGNVTGDGNTIGDGNSESSFGDGNVVGDGNGSGNVDLTATVDLGADDAEPAGVGTGA